MKKLILVLCVVTSFSMQSHASSDHRHKRMVIEEIEEIRRDQAKLVKQNKMLKRKVENLTYLVEQIKGLLEQQIATKPVYSTYSCSLDSRIGTFLGTGSHKVEAGARALQQCERKFNKTNRYGPVSSYCNRRKLVCGESYADSGYSH